MTYKPTVHINDGVPVTTFVCTGCGTARQEMHVKEGQLIPSLWGLHEGLPYCGKCRVLILGDL